MSQKLAGKVAVVTGASKGIGAEIAVELAAAGAKVVVNYASSKAGADRVVAKIVENGGQAVAVQANVADQKDVQRLFAETKKVFGGLDVLVNNAGVYEFSPLESITAEHFHRQYDLNVLGLLFATQEAAKLFGQEGGSISISVRLWLDRRFPGPRFTAGRRRRWKRSRVHWRRSWVRERFA